MRKTGVNQSGKTTEGSKDPKTPTPKKRGRQPKAKGKDTVLEGEEDAGADEMPSKKVKRDAGTKEDAGDSAGAGVDEEA